MITLKRCLTYMKRIPASLGFGVQSPFAYNFIKNVARDSNIGIIKGLVFSLFFKHSVRKRQIFYFLSRLSKYSNSDTYFVCEDLYSSFYLNAISGGINRKLCSFSTYSIIPFALINHHFRSIDSLLDKMSGRSVLIVMDIRIDKQSFIFWNNILMDTRSGVSFDLYDFGVVFFNKKISKHHYFCNL